MAGEGASRGIAYIMYEWHSILKKLKKGAGFGLAITACYLYRENFWLMVISKHMLRIQLML